MMATVLVIVAFGVGSVIAAFLAARALASGFQHVWRPGGRTDVDPGA
jgi:hypothetical protein